VFEGGRAVKTDEPDIKDLHAKIGQQALGIDFLEHAPGRTNGPSAKP
jgi:hypothetical protein